MRSLLHQLAFGVWALQPEAADAYAPQVQQLMENGWRTDAPHPDEAKLMREARYQFVTAGGRSINPVQEQVEPEPGLVMMFSIDGVIMQDDNCGAPGARTMANWLRQAEATPEVSGVVLLINSPGGSGIAMMQLVHQLEMMTKPVVSLVDGGIAASAAYGIAAATDHIMVGTDADEVGSIGTYATLRDYSGSLEKAGVKVHTITATRSQQKLSAYQTALKADPKDPNDPHYATLRAQKLDPFNEVFIALVQRNRPQVKDEDGVFEGRMFFPPDALRLGLIDSMHGSVDDAVQKVRELTNQNR